MFTKRLAQRPNTALQQTRRLFLAVAVRGSFGATPFGRRLSSAAGAAQLSAYLLGGHAMSATTVLETKRLGATARSYVADALGSGKTLSQLVLRDCDLETGAITADLPKALPPESLADLRDGGIVSSEAARSALVARIVRFLSSSRGALVIFEDQLATPTDPITKKSPTKMVALGEELYHLLYHSDANAFAAESTLSWQANAWQEIIFFSELAKPLSLSCATQVSKDELELIAHNTVEICVSAFDGEGYAIWSARAGSVAA